MEVEATGAREIAAVGTAACDMAMLLWTEASVIGPTGGLAMVSPLNGTQVDQCCYHDYKREVRPLKEIVP